MAAATGLVDPVSAAGDVNGDGFADLIVGAYQADPNGTDIGATYVVFGKPGGFEANLNLSTLDGTNGLRISGVAAGDLCGVSVREAGDFNGDGFGDLIIGAHGADSNGADSGAAYVIFVARAPEIHVWDGSASNDWFTAANWTPDGVPA